MRPFPPQLDQTKRPQGAIEIEGEADRCPREDRRFSSSCPIDIDAPIYQDTCSSGLGVVFEASNDLSRGPTIGGAACDVVDGRLVEPHLGLAVAASIPAMSASGHPRGGRDRTRAAELRKGGVRANAGGVVAEKDQQLGGGVGTDPEALAQGGRRLGRESRKVESCSLDSILDSSKAFTSNLMPLAGRLAL